MIKEKDKTVINRLDKKGYKEPSALIKGYRTVLKGKKGMLDVNDNEASDFIYDYISEVYGNNYVCAKNNGKRGYLGLSNNKFEELFDFRDYANLKRMNDDGFAFVQKKFDKKYLAGVVNLVGELIVPFKYRLRYSHKTGYFLSTYSKSSFYSINKKGELVKIK